MWSKIARKISKKYPAAYTANYYLKTRCKRSQTVEGNTTYKRREFNRSLD